MLIRYSKGLNFTEVTMTQLINKIEEVKAQIEQAADENVAHKLQKELYQLQMDLLFARDFRH